MIKQLYVNCSLRLTEKTLREKFEQEKKLLTTRHQSDLIVLKQSIEKEKQDLQKKLRFVLELSSIEIDNFM